MNNADINNCKVVYKGNEISYGDYLVESTIDILPFKPSDYKWKTHCMEQFGTVIDGKMLLTCFCPEGHVEYGYATAINLKDLENSVTDENGKYMLNMNCSSSKITGLTFCPICGKKLV